MGIFSRFQKKELRSRDATDDFWYSKILGTASTPAGQRVTVANSEQVAAVFACQTAICQSIAMLPPTVMSETVESRKEQKKDHPLWKILRVSPNSFMDRFTFFDTMQRNLFSGNSFAHIGRTKAGEIVSLTPLDSEKIEISFDDKTNALSYIYRQKGGQSRTYTQREIFHLKCFSKDGLVGRSPILIAAETVGSALSLQEHGNTTFENGAYLKGILTTEGSIKDPAAEQNIVESFMKWIREKKSVALLQQGLKYNSIQQNNTEAQFLDLRKFSVEEICRIFRVPPQFVQVMTAGMSYASVEQVAISFVQYTIQPWVLLWESAIKHQLLGEEEDVSVRFNISSLIRGDLKTRTESIVQQLANGLLTINEGRALLDRNEVEDEIADKILISHNLIPADKVGEEPPSNISGTPDPADSNVGETKSLLPIARSFFSRLDTRERRSAERARKKGEEFFRNNFLPQFRAEHLDHVAELLEPLAEAFGKEKSPEFSQLVEDYVRGAESALSLNLEHDPARAEWWAVAALEVLSGASPSKPNSGA